MCLQGLCTTEDCPYAHVKVDPNAPVCQEFVAGHCPRGVACTKKHLTPRMIRQLRQSKALQASRQVSQGSTSSAMLQQEFEIYNLTQIHHDCLKCFIAKPSTHHPMLHLVQLMACQLANVSCLSRLDRCLSASKSLP